MCFKKYFTREEIEKAKNNSRIDLQKEASNLRSNLDTWKYFGNVAFVIFNKITDYEEFYSWFPDSNLSYILFIIKKIFICCFKVKAEGKNFAWMNSFKVEKAPEPEDIIWDNLNYTDHERKKRTIKTYLLSIFLSIINFGIILAFNYLEVIYYLINLNLFDLKYIKYF